MTAQPTNTIRALGLCSGGLDSILSALILQQQGVHVEWITFETPFFSAAKARNAADQTGIKLHIEDITPDYLEMLKSPPAGYGKNMNPCMDCHSLMFNKAGAFMQANRFNFLFSGEVVGQRPMSQTSNSMRYVAKHSGFDEYILRPLSAQCLPETQMEKSGLVDRQQLMGLSGRSRKPQMALAEKLGIKEYPAPAGGCLLTDPGYSRRLKDLLDHNAGLTVNALHLLKYGRHMRLNDTTKIVVGRTKGDNEQILKHCDPKRDVVLKVKEYPGPTVVMPGGGPKEMIFLAGAICAGYSKAPEASPVNVQTTRGGNAEYLTVLSVQPDESRRFLIT